MRLKRPTFAVAAAAASLGAAQPAPAPTLFALQDLSCVRWLDPNAFSKDFLQPWLIGHIRADAAASDYRADVTKGVSDDQIAEVVTATCQTQPLFGLQAIEIEAINALAARARSVTGGD